MHLNKKTLLKSENHTNNESVWPWILVPISFFTTMLVISLLVGFAMWDKGEPLILSCIGGASFGFFITWCPAFIITRVFFYITRGVPFRDGQPVLITKGQYKGATGIIQQRDSQQATVLVQLDNDADGNSINHSDWFDWLHVRRA
ncbi:MAG: KOW domain-containing RNA-binding protein [Planctomycetota bacterium]|jgi:hypothetical protein